MQSYSVQENMTLKAAGTKRRSQVTDPGHRSRSKVTGHRSQVTENAKKVRHSAGLVMFIYLFVSFPVTPGICLALTMLPVVLRVKELNIESYTLY